jgi:hypothetical protein
MNKRQIELLELLDKLDNSYLYQKGNSPVWMISFSGGLHRMKANIMVHEVVELEDMGKLTKLVPNQNRYLKPELVLT